MTQEEFYETAQTIRQLYPAGLKPGTQTPWRDSINAIVLRLKKVEKIFQIKLDSNSVIAATDMYLQSFSEDQHYMKVLKYFILKQSSDKEYVSDLLTYIEMLQDEEPIINQDWISNLK